MKPKTDTAGYGSVPVPKGYRVIAVRSPKPGDIYQSKLPIGLDDDGVPFSNGVCVMLDRERWHGTTPRRILKRISETPKPRAKKGGG